MVNWYLIQTKPNAHMLAFENLKRQGFEVFLPLILKTSKKGSKFVDNLKPLFPGYLFIGTEKDQIPWTSVNASRGVSKAVTIAGSYKTIAPEIIDGIQNRCDQSGVIKTSGKIVTGDRVKIERGAFTDFICNVEKISESERAWVLIEILNQKIRAQVDLCDLSNLN